jgi:HEAT repeat protein
VTRALVVLCLLSTAAFAQVGRCEKTCVQLIGHRPDCNACLTNPDDRGSWLEHLSEVPAGALESDDWQVRWGALSRDAVVQHRTPKERLERAITGSTGAARVQACEVAVHLAGVDHHPLKAFLTPAAVRACNEAPVHQALEARCFSLDFSDGPEALLHASIAWETPPVRLMLDALRSRPSVIDHQASELLMLAAMSRNEPVGRALLDHAKAADTEFVNRLLASFSALRDELRPKLEDASVDVRAATVQQLRWLAPLSEPELSQAMADPAMRVRREAASALAAGEHLSLADAARGRLFGPERANPEVRTQWLAALQDSGASGCGDVAMEAWKDLSQPEQVRAAAYEAATSCGAVTSDQVLATARGPQHVEQLAAMRALRFARSGELARVAVEQGLGAHASDVLAAAVRAAGAHRLSAVTGRVDTLRTSTDPSVRAEVLVTLAIIMPSVGRGRALEALAHDESELVRCAAARALAELGGPPVMAALKTASQSDASAKVRKSALEAFQKLGGR